MGVEAVPFSAVPWIWLGLFVVGHWVLLAWPTLKVRSCCNLKLTGCLGVPWAGNRWINTDNASASVGLDPGEVISFLFVANQN